MPIHAKHEAANALWRFTSEHRAGERDLASFSQALADLVCKVLGVPNATIWTIDHTDAYGSSLRPLASSSHGSVGEQDTPPPIQWPNSSLLLAEIDRHSVVSCADTAFAVLPLALQAMRLAVSTPKALMVVGGYLNGLLVSLICVTSDGCPRRWSGVERQLLQRLSAQIVACVAHRSQAGVLRLVERSLD